MAATVRGGDVEGVIFHTDKGGEYVGDLFARACEALVVTQSMGRVGSALDNAAAESFNSTLEHELLSRRHFATKDQARREVARFVDAYNHRRRHSSCEMLPPVAYEALLAERAAEAWPHRRDEARPGRGPSGRARSGHRPTRRRSGRDCLSRPRLPGTRLTPCNRATPQSSTCRAGPRVRQALRSTRHRTARASS